MNENYNNRVSIINFFIGAVGSLPLARYKFFAKVTDKYERGKFKSH